MEPTWLMIFKLFTSSVVCFGWIRDGAECGRFPGVVSDEERGDPPAPRAGSAADQAGFTGALSSNQRGGAGFARKLVCLPIRRAMRENQQAFWDS